MSYYNYYDKRYVPNNNYSFTYTSLFRNGSSSTTTYISGNQVEVSENVTKNINKQMKELKKDLRAVGEDLKDTVKEVCMNVNQELKSVVNIVNEPNVSTVQEFNDVIIDVESQQHQIDRDYAFALALEQEEFDEVD